MSDTLGNINIATEAQSGVMGRNAIGIGRSAANLNQGRDSIAIGYGAGHANQGREAVAIGKFAAPKDQHDNTLVLNATGCTIATRHTNAVYMGPIAAAAGPALEPSARLLAYDLDTAQVVPTTPHRGIRGVMPSPATSTTSPRPSISFALANGSMSTVEIPNLFAPGATGPAGTSVDGVSAADDGRVLVSTSNGIVHDLGLFQGAAGAPGSGVASVRLDTAESMLYVDLVDEPSHRNNYHQAGGGGGETPRVLKTVEVPLGVVLDSCELVPVGTHGPPGADLEAVTVGDDGYVNLAMSDGRSIAASGTQFRGEAGPRGPQGPPGSRGDDGVAVQAVMLNREADRLVATYTDGSEHVTSPVRGPCGAPGVDFAGLAVTPQGDLTMALAANGKPLAPLVLGSVYAAGADGRGATGPAGAGISTIAYDQDTHVLRIELDSHTLIEIPDFVGAVGPPGADADPSGAIAGEAGDDGPRGERGPPGGLPLTHSTPYTGEGDFVSYSGTEWTNGLLTPLPADARRPRVTNIQRPDCSDASVYLGEYAGSDGRSEGSVGLGERAGAMKQGGYAVALGAGAGYAEEGKLTVAVGTGAGGSKQGAGAVAVGVEAGASSQGEYSLAVGKSAGTTCQGREAVAVGHAAGNVRQGEGAIAVGAGAGFQDQGAQSIVLGSQAFDADGAGLKAGSVQLGTTVRPTQAGTTYPPAAMGVSTGVGVRMYYNPATSEITHAGCPTLDVPYRVSAELTDRLLQVPVRAERGGPRLGLDMEELADLCPEFMLGGGVNWRMVRDALEARVEQQYVQSQKMVAA